MVMSGLESSFAKQVAYAHCVPPRAPAFMFKRREVGHCVVDVVRWTTHCSAAWQLRASASWSVPF